jgi:hypothetical protein
MQQNRMHATESVRAALASTALVAGFAEQFHSEKQIEQLSFLLERVVLASAIAKDASYNDLLSLVVPVLAQRRNVFADSAMFTEVRHALYPSVHIMRRFQTAEDLQIGFQTFQTQIVLLAQAARPGYTPADREMFTLAAGIGTLQWLDVPVPGTNETQRAECAVLERTELVEFIGVIEKQSPAADANRRLLKENEELRRRVSELEAARIAYASEFPLTEDGDPDVGNIHANIRKLKAERRLSFVKQDGQEPLAELCARFTQYMDADVVSAQRHLDSLVTYLASQLVVDNMPQAEVECRIRATIQGNMTELARCKSSPETQAFFVLYLLRNLGFTGSVRANNDGAHCAAQTR